MDRPCHLSPKRLECIPAANPHQQRYRGVTQRSEPPSRWQIQITILLVNRTSSSRSPPNFPDDKVDIGQEVKADPDEKLQATSGETVRRLGAVPDRQQKRFRTT